MSQQQADKIQRELDQYDFKGQVMDLVHKFELRRNDGYLTPWNPAVALMEEKKAMEAMKTLSQEQKIYAVGGAASKTRRSLSTTIMLCAFSFAAGLILPKACSSDKNHNQKETVTKVVSFNPDTVKAAAKSVPVLR